MAPKRLSFSQKDLVKSVKIIKQNSEDEKTERTMMIEVVHEKVDNCGHALRKVFNMVMGKQLEPPRVLPSEDDLPLQSVKWRLLTKTIRTAGLESIGNGDPRIVRFLQAPHTKARINDDTLDIDGTCVMVLKNCGPKGYPGMPEVGNMGLPPKIL